MELHKNELITALANFIEERRTDWTPFAITTVFKSKAYKSNETKWSDEYVHKVLWKINKRLNSSATDIVFYHDFRYEMEIKGQFKSAKILNDGRCPHHIH